MPEYQKVSMELTNIDLENAKTVMQHTPSQSKADAIGVALAIAAKILEKDYKNISIVRSNGKVETLVIPPKRNSEQ